MTTVVNSKERLMSGPEMLMLAAQELNNTEYPTEKVALALAKEISMPSADLVQIGNTVYIGHTSPKRPDIMEGRAFNFDTARNFLKGGWDYFRYLQNKGIKYYRVDFQYTPYLRMFERWLAAMNDTDSQLAVVQLDNGMYRGMVTFGEEKLPEFGG